MQGLEFGAYTQVSLGTGLGLGLLAGRFFPTESSWEMEELKLVAQHLPLERLGFKVSPTAQNSPTALKRMVFGPKSLKIRVLTGLGIEILGFWLVGSLRLLFFLLGGGGVL